MKLKMFFLLISIATIMQPKNLLNKPAPLFTAPAINQAGDEFIFDLFDYRGKKLVLYFYPMDNTPGCSKQAENFKKNIDLLTAENITVVGISCDSINSHKKFQKKFKLPFILVSDKRWSRFICKAYQTSTFFLSKRTTFCVNENGIIVKTFTNINIENQVPDIIKAFENQN